MSAESGTMLGIRERLYLSMKYVILARIASSLTYLYPSVVFYKELTVSSDSLSSKQITYDYSGLYNPPQHEGATTPQDRSLSKLDCVSI